MMDGKRAPQRPGGKLLADALVAQGVTHAFCVPGESYLDLLDGLYAQRNRIQLVTCRFEAGAVHMAEAYGKLTGRPGVALVTRGPGACHASIGVHVAFQDSTPLVLIVGQIPFEETDRESFQEVDYRKMFAPLAKWVTQIDDAARIPELMAHAFDVARSGRPGPVVVAISEEMQREVAAVPDIGPARVLPPHPAPEAVPAMMDLLRRAQRPLAVLGGGGWTAEGRTAVRDFLLEGPDDIKLFPDPVLKGSIVLCPLTIDQQSLGGDPVDEGIPAAMRLPLFGFGTRAALRVTAVGSDLFVSGHEYSCYLSGTDNPR